MPAQASTFLLNKDANMHYKTSLQADALSDNYTNPRKRDHNRTGQYNKPLIINQLTSRTKPKLHILPSQPPPTMRIWALWLLTVSTWLLLFTIMTSLCQHECRRNTFLAGGPNILWLRCLVYCNTLSLAFAILGAVGLGGGAVLAAAEWADVI